MRHPWQVWLLFLLCLAVVLPAMGWLSIKAVELDRAELAARRQTDEARRLEAAARQQAEAARQQAEYARVLAEQQELVNSALWRIDWTLTPLIAQEAARPYFVYWPFYPPDPGPASKGEANRQVPSPLLIQPSDYVLLHFQLAADESWSSPQTPSGPLAQVAIENGAPAVNIKNSNELLRNLRGAITHDQLISLLPEQMLPAMDLDAARVANNLTWNYDGNSLGPDPFASDSVASFPFDEDPFGADGTEQQQQQSIPPPKAPPAKGQQQQQALAQQQDFTQQQFAQQQAVPQQQLAKGPDYDAPQQQDDESYGGYKGGPRDQAARGGAEFQRRSRAYSSYAQTQVAQQRLNTTTIASPQRVREGVSRPIWVGEKLLLARRVERDGQVLIQGCWLNWDKIKQMLMIEVQDLLPEMDLAPVIPEVAAQPGRILATLPVQIVVPEIPLPQPRLATDQSSLDGAATLLAPALLEGAEGATFGILPPLSPIQLSLILAWSCMLLAMIAVAVLLRGVVALSERRGAFVSAVTHELRTPLTTFRMYAEMLAEGMVPTAQQRQQYLETLRVEADRLSHLVENVLAYARLERGRHGQRRETLRLETLLDRVEPRLRDRAAQANMQFCVEADQATRAVTLATDPAAVEQILFNLVDNACKYAAAASDRRIHLRLRDLGRAIEMRVTDHGPGITRKQAKRLFRPFSKSVDEAANTAPGVGLGLALCRRLARALGGQLELQPNNGSGAAFALVLKL